MTSRAILRLALAVGLLAAGPQRLVGQQPAGPALSLEELERMALENAPTLAQARAEVEIARGRAAQSGLLPNPVVGYVSEEGKGARIFGAREQGFFLEQTVPLGGKLDLASQVFERQATEAEALVELQRARVLGSVRARYYETLAQERRVEAIERLAGLASEAVLVSRQLFNVGAADRPDVLEAEIEAQRAQVELTRARNVRFAAWRRLAAAAGVPALAPRPLAGSLEAALPELEREDMERTLADRSPQVRAARAALARAEATVARARRESAPDLVLRASSIHDRGEPGSSLTGWRLEVEAGVTIPVFNRNQGNVRAALGDLARAQGELRRLEFELASRLAGAFESYLSALRAAEAYRTEILPRAEEAYRLYLSRYREMAAAYPQVLIAQRTLFQVTEQYLGLLEDAWRASVRLQAYLAGDGLEPASRPGEPIGTEGPDVSTTGSGPWEW